MAAKTAKKSRTVKKAGTAKKRPARRAAKPARKTAAKKTSARKAAPRKAVKAKKQAPARKKKQIVGEGDYEASRAFLKDQAGFVSKNKARIPAMGKAAKAALDGPEGASLRQAEAEARRHGAPDQEAEPAPGAFVIPPG
jgi:hypothetical protein